MKDQYILLIETSSENCSVAIANHCDVVASQTEQAGTTHVSYLTIMVENCLQNAKIGFTDLAAVALSDGPGSYTSLRVGASTAKGICFACSIPLIAVSTLKALAMAARSAADHNPLVPMIDARRMEVFCAVYDRDLRLLSQPENIIFDPQTVEKILPLNSVLCGNGATKVHALLPHGTNVQLSSIIECDARYLVELADGLYKQKAFSDLTSYNPTYFKAPNITSSKKNII